MKTLQGRSLWLWVAVVALTAMPAWADGELDTTFGINGVVKIAFPNSSRGYLRDAAMVNGTIIAAGYVASNGQLPNCSFPDLYIVKLSPTGAIIGSPATYPQHSVECPNELIVDPGTGDIYLVAGSDDKLFLHPNSDPAPVPGSNGGSSGGGSGSLSLLELCATLTLTLSRFAGQFSRRR